MLAAKQKLEPGVPPHAREPIRPLPAGLLAASSAEGERAVSARTALFATASAMIFEAFALSRVACRRLGLTLVILARPAVVEDARR